MTTAHNHAPVVRVSRNRLSPPRGASARFFHTVGTYPSMRMPRNTGAIHLDSADLDPSGSLCTLTGTWTPRLTPTDTDDGDLVLQLHAPHDQPDNLERTNVRLWLARTHSWHHLRSWYDSGPGWPHDIAPWVHAALG